MFIFLDPCMAPLGMQDGRIANYRLTASSMYNHYYGPWAARLQGRKGGWLSKYNNHAQWIQADLETMTRVKGVAIQGRYNGNQFVKSFTVSFSRDGSRFYPYKEGRGTKVKEMDVKLFQKEWSSLIFTGAMSIRVNRVN